MTTTTGRKVRADAKLEHLNAEQHERLRGWLEEKSYDSVVSLVRQEFGLSVGKSALSVYWRRHLLPEQQQDDAETAAALTALPAGDFDAAILQQLRALAWAAVARPFPNIDTAAKLLAMVYRAEQHALALKRLALAERRVALREALADRRAAAAERRSEASREQVAATPAPHESQNPPRFPGYSGLLRPHTEAESPANCANAKAGLETTKDTKKHEGAGRSAEAVGRDEHTEVATKAQRCEGRNKEPEDANSPAPVAEPAASALPSEDTIPQPRHGSQSKQSSDTEVAEEKGC